MALKGGFLKGTCKDRFERPGAGKGEPEDSFLFGVPRRAREYGCPPGVRRDIMFDLRKFVTDILLGVGCETDCKALLTAEGVSKQFPGAGGVE